MVKIPFRKKVQSQFSTTKILREINNFTFSEAMNKYKTKTLKSIRNKFTQIYYVNYCTNQFTFGTGIICIENY